MTTIHRQARVMQAANAEASKVWPSVHEEAMDRAMKFGQAKGLLEMWLETMSAEEVSSPGVRYMMARTAKVLEEWK